MNVNSIVGSVPHVQSESPAPSLPGSSSGGFSRIIDQIMANITAPTRAGEQAVHDLAQGRTDNVHQVLLTVAQADLAFRLMLEIRNRLTEAYQEIQRMQI